MAAAAWLGCQDASAPVTGPTTPTAGGAEPVDSSAISGMPPELVADSEAGASPAGPSVRPAPGGAGGGAPASVRVAQPVVGSARRPSRAGGGASGAGKATADGAALYDRLCADCHGVGGEGDGPRAQELNPRPTDLTGPRPRAHQSLPGGRLGVIRSGLEETGMPAFGSTLTEQELRAVGQYVYELAHGSDGRGPMGGDRGPHRGARTPRAARSPRD